MKRFGRMLLGYVAASYAAAFAGSVCSIIVLWFIGDDGASWLSFLMIMTPIAGTVILLFAALPSIFVLYWLGKRQVARRAPYVIGGAVVGLICVAVLALLSGPDFANPTVRRLTTGATYAAISTIAGAIGGYIYWWIAGRDAGSGIKSEVDPTVFD